MIQGKTRGPRRSTKTQRKGKTNLAGAETTTARSCQATRADRGGCHCRGGAFSPSWSVFPFSTVWFPAVLRVLLFICSDKGLQIHSAQFHSIDPPFFSSTQNSLGADQRESLRKKKTCKVSPDSSKNREINHLTKHFFLFSSLLFSQLEFMFSRLTSFVLSICLEFVRIDLGFMQGLV